MVEMIDAAVEVIEVVEEIEEIAVAEATVEIDLIVAIVEIDQIVANAASDATTIVRRQNRKPNRSPLPRCRMNFRKRSRAKT